MSTTIPGARPGPASTEETGGSRGDYHNSDHSPQLPAHHSGREAEQLPALPSIPSSPVCGRGTILPWSIRCVKIKRREHGSLDSFGFDGRLVVQCYRYVC